MIQKFFFTLWLIFSLSTLACAGYSDMKKAFDTYQPSGFFQDQFHPLPVPTEPDVDHTFVLEKNRIEALKAQWERALKTTGEQESFLALDPDLDLALRQAKTDVSAAENALAGTFSLKRLETLTLLRNAGIKAAEDRLRGAIEAFTQVTALDEILRQYSAFTKALMVGVGPMKGKEPVDMAFPFPGVMTLKGEIVNQEVRAQQERLEAARRDAVTGMRKAYWDLVYVFKAERVTAEMIALLKRLESVANSRYESGRTSYQDVIKVRIRREVLDENLITLREKQKNLEAKTREILNLSPTVKLGLPETAQPAGSVPVLQDLYLVARERRQELRSLRAQINKMELMIEMAETMILPGYTLNHSLYGNEPVNDTGSFAKREAFPIRTNASSGAGLPKMPWYGTEDAYLRETRQKLYALREELKQAETKTNTMVRNTWFDIDRAGREAALYRDEIVKLSRSALDASTRGYESGNVTFADVIDSYTTWLQANLTLEKKRSDFEIAWAELEQVVGTSLR
jgi:hypothetical protein